MKLRSRSFNLYFILFCVVVAAGCASDKKADEKKEHKKEQSTIRLYMEDNGPGTGVVQVTRDKIPIPVEREPFLTEADLKKASLVNEPDGTFSIQLVFDDHASLLLDMKTSSSKGRHIVVFSQFPPAGTKPAKEKKKKKSDDDDDVEINLPAADPEKPAVPATQGAQAKPGQPRQSAWLAAVMIRGDISNGLFRFAPDASHAEGVRIVRGLRNVIAQAKHRGILDNFNDSFDRE
jgi:hypothetical protein